MARRNSSFRPSSLVVTRLLWRQSNFGRQVSYEPARIGSNFGRQVSHNLQVSGDHRKDFRYSYHQFIWSDAFYDRGCTIPLKCFLDDGVINPKIVGMPILFRKLTFFCAWAMRLVIGTQFDYC